MPRAKSNPAHKCFTYCLDDGYSTCDLDNPNTKERCGTRIKGKHGANLERHLRAFHSEQWNEKSTDYSNNLKRKADSDNLPTKTKQLKQLSLAPKIQISLTKADVWNACIELCTVNGRPFAILEDSGFRKILDPILESLGNNYKFNSHNIKVGVLETAETMKQSIKREVQGKLISLKLDGVTNNNRSFLGVNLQFIDDGEVKLRTLATREITDRHTAETLKNLVIDILKDFEVSIDQIYTCTTDNGTNMVKAISLLSEEKETEDDFEDEFNSQLENIVNDTSLQKLCIGIRCAEHTLQLAINDALKSSPAVLNQISKARAVVKKLRAQNISSLLSKEGISKPVIDCPTRWGSTFDMLESLITEKLRKFCRNLAIANETFHLNASTWDNVTEVVNILRPSKIATMKLQCEQLTFSDFYGIWATCKLETQKFGHSLAGRLVAEMERREQLLFTNDAFIAAIYMDPRYQIILSLQQKEKAVDILTSLYCKVFELHERNSVTAPPNSPEISGHIIEPTYQPEDEFEAMLQALETSAPDSSTSPVSQPANVIRPLLKEFGLEKRLAKESNILDYWKQQALKKPELHRLSEVALAVPATQVIVELLFSGLKFLVGHLRCSLKGEMVDAISLIRTNHRFGLKM